MVEQILNKKKLKNFNVDHCELYFANKLLEKDFSSDTEFEKFAEMKINSNMLKRYNFR